MPICARYVRHEADWARRQAQCRQVTVERVLDSLRVQLRPCEIDGAEAIDQGEGVEMTPEEWASIRRDVQWKTELERRLVARLDDLEHGQGTELTSQDWEEMRQELEEHIAKRSAS